MLSVGERAENMCCGDGISLTFLAVMRCSLIFFCGVAVYRSPRVPLINRFIKTPRNFLLAVARLICEGSNESVHDMSAQEGTIVFFSAARHSYMLELAFN